MLIPKFGLTCLRIGLKVAMKYFMFIGCILLITVACKKNKTKEETTSPVVAQLKLSVQPVFASENLDLDSTYTTEDGWDIQFSDIKFYMTNFGNGSNKLVDVARFDYREKGTACFQVAGNFANFSALTGFIGVPADLNHNDPSAPSTSSPLNILNTNGMHWSWNTGYVFVIIEARVDTIPDGIPLFDHFLTYHVGTDSYLGTANFSTVNWIDCGGGLHATTLQLDLKQLIDHPTNPVDLITEFTTHSGGAEATLTQKIKSNFLDALTAP